MPDASAGGAEGSGPDAGPAGPIDRSVAQWPVPNQPGQGLPNPQKYKVMRLGGDEMVRDEVTGLVWQRRVSGSRLDWQGARDYCDGLSLGGREDWRLPTRIELTSLVDLSYTAPAIDPVTFPNTPSEWYWTDSEQAGDDTRAWYVYFYFGYVDTDAKENPSSARCVSGGRQLRGAGAAVYVLTADTAHDPATGLTWQRQAAAEPLSLDAGKQACAALRLAGFDDWRVPTMREIESIVDERRANPGLDSSVFLDGSSDSFWSATPWAEGQEQAWHVNFDYGGALYEKVDVPYRIRCVRSQP